LDDKLKIKMIKNILGRVFTIWGGLVFVGTMLIFIVPIWATGLMPEPNRTAWVIRFCRMWMALFFPLSGIRLTIKGRSQFKKGENYVVVCNHNSLMDVQEPTKRSPRLRCLKFPSSVLFIKEAQYYLIVKMMRAESPVIWK